jgi:hypothetical protein
MRAVPKSANSTHIAMATNNGPIFGKRTGGLPTSYAIAILRCDARTTLSHTETVREAVRIVG